MKKITVRVVAMSVAAAFALTLAGASIGAQTGRPKSVRDYLLLLPKDYWALECCAGRTGAAYQQAVADFVRERGSSVLVDERNGYVQINGDGAQEGLRMALFKRPNGTHLIGLEVSGEGGHRNYFLEYRSGRWVDVAARVIPQYSTRNYYEVPRYGTTVQVFKAAYPEPGNHSSREKGAKLYNLAWKAGRFTIEK